MMEEPIPVVGGGWAGCAAALTLAQNGCRVALYEAAPILGGRARGVSRDGLPLDNGQHLLLGAYTETLPLLALAHASSAPPISRSRLQIAPLSATQTNAVHLVARDFPPPFGLLCGLLAARGITFSERIATIGGLVRWKRRDWRCAPEVTVAQLLSELPARVGQTLWEPLCLAALNTPTTRASGQVFLNVMRAAFDTSPDGADVVLPRENLSALFPDAAARRLVARGHAVHLRTKATVQSAGTQGVTLRVGDATVAAPAAIVAVGPHQLLHALDGSLLAGTPEIVHALDSVTRLEYESITTVYLGYTGAVAIGAGLVRLDDAPGQWVFDRGDILAHASPGAVSISTLLAVVISANGPHDHRPRDDLAHDCDTQLRRLRPGLPPSVWSHVIAERRATYACTPQAVRPASGAIAPNLYLAGDFTDSEFPATLEAAVRSGRRAAHALVADRR